MTQPTPRPVQVPGCANRKSPAMAAKSARNTGIPPTSELLARTRPATPAAPPTASASPAASNSAVVTGSATTAQASDRPCIACGKIFHGVKRTCPQCLSHRTASARSAAERSAASRTHAHRAAPCSVNATTARLRGTGLACLQCCATDRDLRRLRIGRSIDFHDVLPGTAVCQNGSAPRATVTFRGDQRECRICRTTTSSMRQLRKRRSAARVTWNASPAQAGAMPYNAARRIRRLAAQIDGPLPRSVYRAILASGPCVYCDKPTTCLDHVRPLARGGQETASNLVPACQDCNGRKSARLLIHWDPERVAHGAARSPIVAAELKRERMA